MPTSTLWRAMRSDRRPMSTASATRSMRGAVIDRHDTAVDAPLDAAARIFGHAARSGELETARDRVADERLGHHVRGEQLSTPQAAGQRPARRKNDQGQRDREHRRPARWTSAGVAP